MGAMWPVSRSRRGLMGALVLISVAFLFQWDGKPSTLSLTPSRTSLDLDRNATTVKIRPATHSHTFRDDGILEVNPLGAHPITELMTRSEALWKEKLARASRTLEDAVEEYERRYNRLPPKGFDVWWNYVQEHNVQLPDEYDQIHRDLAPFWGVHPSDLETLIARRSRQQWVLVLGKERPEDGVSVLEYTIPSEEWRDAVLGPTERYQLDVIRPIEHLLPPFRILFQPHDNGNLFSNHAARRAALIAAEVGEHIDILNWPLTRGRRAWGTACPPDSPVNLHPANMSSPLPLLPTTPTPKTFIHAALPAVDPCAHPDLLRLSGFFLAQDPGPGQELLLVPQLSPSKTALYDDIAVASTYGWVDAHPGGQVGWREKRDGRLLWRGSTTGIQFGEDMRWRESHRARLVELTNAREGSVRVLHDADVGEGDVGKIEVDLGEINEAFVDIAFAGHTIQCDRSVCDEVEETYAFREPVGRDEEGEYKFIMDIDGNGWSGRFKRLMTSGSLIFKSTIYPEWFTDRIQPWVHYVPVQMDFSDLYDSLAYFRGGLPSVSASAEFEYELYDEGEDGYDRERAVPGNAPPPIDARLDRARKIAEKRERGIETENFNRDTGRMEAREASRARADARARKIAEAGLDWSRRFWRKEDLTAYQFRLLLEYIRVMSPDRDSVSTAYHL